MATRERKLLWAMLVAIVVLPATYVVIRSYPKIGRGGLVLIIALVACAAVTFVIGLGQSVIKNVIWPRGDEICDDRGRIVPVDEVAVRATRFPVSRERLAIARKAARRAAMAPLWIRVVGWLPLVMIATSIVAWTASRLIGFSFPPAIEYVVIGLVAIGLLVNARQVTVHAMRMRILVAMLHGRCAACLYDLSALKSESDGCVVCPECGAAWVLNRCPQCAAALGTRDTAGCPECGWGRADV